MKHILLIVFFLSNTLLWSQFDLLNQWGYGGDQNDYPVKITNEEILVLSNSGISGNKNVPNYGSMDAWIITLDNDNGLIDEFVFGGSGSDYPVDIVDFFNRKYLLMMSSSSTSGNKTMDDYGTGMDRGDFWLLKLDNNYQIIDQWNYGTNLFDGAGGFFPFQNNLVLYGSSQGPVNNDKSENGRGGTDAWIICVDTNGNKLWDKTLGGSGAERFVDAKVVSDGFIFIGVSNSNVGFEKSENAFGVIHDIWVVKTDFNGNKIWDKTIGNYGEEEFISAFVENNTLILTFNSFDANNGNLNITNYGSLDACIAKVDILTGNLMHVSNYGGSNIDSFGEILPLNDNKIFFVGSTNSNDGDIVNTLYGSSDIWVGIIDSNSNIIDQALFGSNSIDVTDYALYKNNSLLILANSNGGASGIKTSPNYGEVDVWLLELGNILSQHEEDFSIGFNVFPNPTIDFFYIDLNQMDANKIRVLDMNGKLTYSKSGKISGLIDVDLSKEKPGIYVVKVGLENGVWVSKKITKR